MKMKKPNPQMDDFSDPIWSFSLRTVDGKTRAAQPFASLLLPTWQLGHNLNFKPSEFFRIFFLLPFPNDYLHYFTFICLINYLYI